MTTASEKKEDNAKPTVTSKSPSTITPPIDEKAESTILLAEAANAEQHDEATETVHWLKGYSLDRFFNDEGYSHNFTLAEIQSINHQIRQKVKNPTISMYTALDFVRALMDRASVPYSEQREEAIEIFALALNNRVTDPIGWLNPQHPKAELRSMLASVEQPVNKDVANDGD